MTPFFIFGAPRSGTTFFTTAVNQHPDIYITNELRAWSFLNDLNKRLKKTGPLLPQHPARESFRQNIQRAAHEAVIDLYTNQIDKTNLGCPAQKRTNTSGNTKVFGDKNPGYADPISESGCLEFILECLPNARFAHIVRDPRSVIASYINLPHIYGRDLNRHIDRWLKHANCGSSFIEMLPPEQGLEVRYEDFCGAKGDTILFDIEELLNLTTHKASHLWLTAEQVKRTPLRSPTTPHDSIGLTRYAETLTKGEILKTENACSAAMARFGYAERML